MATGTSKKRAPANGRVTPKARPKATFDHLASAKGIVRHVPIYLDSDITTEYEQAKRDLDTTDEDHKDRAAMQARFEQAEAAMEGNVVILHLRRPIVTTDEGEVLKGRRAYDWLVEQHPATDEQNAESREQHGVDAPYDADTFAAALISSCCEDPVMSVEQAQELIDGVWSPSTTILTFNYAMEVCHASSVGIVGKGSGGTRGF